MSQKPSQSKPQGILPESEMNSAIRPESAPAAVPRLQELQQAVIVKQQELRQAIDALTTATGKPFTPNAPQPSEAQLANCRVLPSRYHLLDHMPKGAICVEVGTQFGGFAEQILKRTKPREFHIIDIDLSVFQRGPIQQHLESGVVKLHEGDSSAILSTFPDGYFDWIYIDGDHSYDGFVKDLRISAKKLKPKGYIVCNDYTVWSPIEAHEYGVLRGVHELCRDDNWEFAFIALQGQGYHDVCLRKRPD